MTFGIAQCGLALLLRDRLAERLIWLPVFAITLSGLWLAFRRPSTASPRSEPIAQPAITSWDGAMVTGNGTTARYSSPPMR